MFKHIKHTTDIYIYIYLFVKLLIFQNDLLLIKLIVFKKIIARKKL